MVLILISLHLVIFIFIFNKVLNNSHTKIDKFGVIRENTVINRKIIYIYLYFFFTFCLYLYIYCYSFLAFLNMVFYDLNLNELWYFCYISVAVNYLLYTTCLLTSLDTYEVNYKSQFYLLSFLMLLIIIRYRFCILCFFSFILGLEILYILFFPHGNNLGVLEEYPRLFTKRFRNFFKTKI